MRRQGVRPGSGLQVTCAWWSRLIAVSFALLVVEPVERGGRGAPAAARRQRVHARVGADESTRNLGRQESRLCGPDRLQVIRGGSPSERVTRRFGLDLQD